MIDSNVILDLVSDDKIWATWSIKRLEAAATIGPIFVNDVVYAEISVRYERIEDLNFMLGSAGIEVAPIPKEALFLAGKVFARYRKAGGTRLGVLPDFFIGAHAVVAAIPLLTRDIARYRTYFPSIEIISPETH